MQQAATPIVLLAIKPWSNAKKMSFRWLFLFFSFYVFFNPNGFLPYVDNAYELYIRPFHASIPWMGKHILHLPYEVTSFSNGSGDTTYDYLVLLLIVVLASMGGIIWSIIDRRHPSYEILRYWLLVFVRYYFAFTMLNYGFAKFFKLQFPFPSPYGLQESYGSSSPMRLAWTFFGYSTGYNYFMGFAEVGSGLLLLFGRTVRIGAILSLVTALNIMAINYCFDVCVKLLSTVLVLMALYILLQDRERHVHYFFRKQQKNIEEGRRPVFRKRWINISMIVFKYVLIVYVLFGDLWDISKASKNYGPDTAKPPLYGIYDIQAFVMNKDTLAPLTTDTTRWRRLIVGSTGRGAIKLMNDSMKIYSFLPDTTTRKIVMYGKDTTKKSSLCYSFIGKDGLLLQGKWFNDSVRIIMKRYDLNNLLLVNRGFHFINETPFNK